MSHNIKKTYVSQRRILEIGTKGDQTRQLICMEALKLFTKKGYKDVTMKDICEKTGLSRGGCIGIMKAPNKFFLKS